MLSAIDRIAFTIGSLKVGWYGIIITSAMVIALIYIAFQAPRIGITRDDAIELFLWIVPLAVVFARVFYVMVRPAEYFPWKSFDDFINAIAIWEGGITIIGGMFGGILGAIIFWLKRRRKPSFGRIIDLVIPTVLLGQSIGRWGNFINQEAYGTVIASGFPEGLPFSVYIERCYENCPCPGSGWHYATFLYESIWNIIGALICVLIWRLMYKNANSRKVPGILGFFYFAWYFIIRALMEFLRTDAVPVTQIASFILFPIAIVVGGLYAFIKLGYDSTARDILGGKKVNPDKISTKVYLFILKLKQKITRRKEGGFADQEASFALVPIKKESDNMATENKLPDLPDGGML